VYAIRHRSTSFALAEIFFSASMVSSPTAKSGGRLPHSSQILFDEFRVEDARYTSVIANGGLIDLRAAFIDHRKLCSGISWVHGFRFQGLEQS
jgi:hypothetical protein